MARRGIILSLDFNIPMRRWRILVIYKNSDKWYVHLNLLHHEAEVKGQREKSKEEGGADGRYHQILISGLTSSPTPISSVVYLVKGLLRSRY